MTSTAKRIILNAVILFSLLALPWWCTAAFALAGIFVFDTFFEAVIAGFIMDSLYGVPTGYFHGITFVSTLAAAAALAVVLYIKPQLR